jgi:putative acetyltransferase
MGTRPDLSKVHVNNVAIREETPADVEAIHQLNVAAFKTDAEARLVDALRRGGALTLSLVAEVDGEVVGHIGFSPVTVTSTSTSTSTSSPSPSLEETVGASVGVSVGVGLAPIAVLPTYQRRGIGASLIQAGQSQLRSRNTPFCVVLGHADYYPRHGFLRAGTFGIRWERPVPEDIFFVQELQTGGLEGVSGVVRFRPEFDSV